MSGTALKGGACLSKATVCLRALPLRRGRYGMVCILASDFFVFHAAHLSFKTRRLQFRGSLQGAGPWQYVEGDMQLCSSCVIVIFGLLLQLLFSGSLGRSEG